MSGRLLRAGERGILVDLPDLDAVLTLNQIVRGLVEAGERPWDAVLDVVPAAVTLFVTVDAPASFEPLRQALDGLVDAQEFRVSQLGRRPRAPQERVVEIPVIYDGPDLAEIAALTGLTAYEVVAAHTGTPWRMAFGGFAPGFPYLVDGDSRLEVPRRAEPRTVVPAGAVGLAGAFSGIYPRASPGGWQLLGHTSAVMWDTDREPPALLQPGWLVRFVAVGV